MIRRGWKTRHVLLGIVVLVTGLAVSAGAASADSAKAGAVYIETNAAAGNTVNMYLRDERGGLSFGGSFATGGLGMGAGLGSQGALALSENGRWLFVVNAGSSEISSFAVGPHGLTLVDKVASGGLMPISLTLHDNLLYVLNAGGAGQINGFTVSARGKLSPIDDSARTLSNNGAGAAPAPAEVAFNPAGTALVVTEKGPSLIDTYPVDPTGMPGARTTQPSAGAVPFGFDFTSSGFLVVSEAANASVSSYAVSPTGSLSVVSPAVVDGQHAACWLVVGGPAGYAYTTNAASGNISSFSIDGAGALSLVQPVAATTNGGPGTHPLDMAFSRHGDFIYNIDAAVGMIHVFAVGSDGGLTFVQDVTGVPASSQGIVAR